MSTTMNNTENTASSYHSLWGAYNFHSSVNENFKILTYLAFALALISAIGLGAYAFRYEAHWYFAITPIFCLISGIAAYLKAEQHNKYSKATMNKISLLADNEPQ